LSDYIFRFARESEGSPAGAEGDAKLPWAYTETAGKSFSDDFSPRHLTLFQVFTEVLRLHQQLAHERQQRMIAEHQTEISSHLLAQRMASDAGDTETGKYHEQEIQNHRDIIELIGAPDGKCTPVKIEG
jgi:hypothetical protein